MTNINILFHWIVTAFAIISHVIIGPESIHYAYLPVSLATEDIVT